MKRLLLFAALLAWSGMAGGRRLQMDRRARQGAIRRPAAGRRACGSRRGARHSCAIGPAGAGARARARRRKVAADQPSTGGRRRQEGGRQDDVAQTRDKQCADAQERYKKLIEGRRLYKTGADGERQYLTSEEIDAERLNAKRDIDTICNSADLEASLRRLGSVLDRALPPAAQSLSLAS